MTFRLLYPHVWPLATTSCLHCWAGKKSDQEKYGVFNDKLNYIFQWTCKMYFCRVYYKINTTNWYKKGICPRGRLTPVTATATGIHATSRMHEGARALKLLTLDYQNGVPAIARVSTFPYKPCCANASDRAQRLWWQRALSLLLRPPPRGDPQAPPSLRQPSNRRLASRAGLMTPLRSRRHSQGQKPDGRFPVVIFFTFSLKWM